VDLRKADPKQPDEIFVRYIATPMPIVEAMLKLAKVGKEDVVYDLGCGDGRIVVTAVSKYGAKQGVGVDIDPARIRDSRLTAKAAGVTDKVEFRREDVLKVKDLDKATVVCLYLGDELNQQLRPILQKVLKPGTRVVSHRFLIGDWKPDTTETVRIGLAEFKLHLWTIKKEDKKAPEKKEPEKKEKPKDKKEDVKKEPEKKKDGKKEKDKEEGEEKPGGA
jgi:SAM-dependent methyltransferase